MPSFWNRSGMVERYADDIRAAGAKAFFFQGGTTTPLVVYQNSAQTVAHPIPVVADANGRWPDVFIPFTTSYDVQVKSADDVQLTFSVLIPNVDPTDVFAPASTVGVDVGMVHGEFIATTKIGYVRCNGRTIGNAASGASERANADCQALFSYLWNNIGNTLAPVSGGRGASASADFTAGKNIQLPDLRGKVMAGLDDMGNAALGAYSGLTFNTGTSTQAMSSVGINGQTITEAQMPPHVHTGVTNSDGFHVHTATVAGTTGVDSPDHHHDLSINTGPDLVDHVHTYSQNIISGSALMGSGASFGTPNQVLGGQLTGGRQNTHTHNVAGSTFAQSVFHTHTFSANVTVFNDSAHTHVFTTNSTGGGAFFNNLQLSLLVTWFIKL